MDYKKSSSIHALGDTFVIKLRTFYHKNILSLIRTVERILVNSSIYNQEINLHLATQHSLCYVV